MVKNECDHIENVGINVPDFTNKLTWIKKLLTPYNLKWKAKLQDVVNPLSIEHIQTNSSNCDK